MKNEWILIENPFSTRYKPDLTRYDGNPTVPDIIVDRSPSDFLINGTDTVLDKVMSLITK